MSRRGFGHTRKLPSGRHQASYIGPDNARHNAPATYRTKAEAEAWLTKQHGLIAAGTWRATAEVQASAAVTVAEWAETHMSVTRATKGWTQRTYDLYRSQLDRLILPELGKIALQDLTDARVEVWYAKLDPSSPTQRAHAYALLRSIMGSAVKRRHISVSPCQLDGAGTSPKAKRKVQIVEMDDSAVVDAIAAALPDRLALMAHVGFWLGLRFGEMTELRRSDVDLDAGVVSVERAVTYVRGEPTGELDASGKALRTPGRFEVGDPKSDAGIRSVAIPPHLVPAIRAHLQQHVLWAPDALLFPSAKDPARHLQHVSWDKPFRRVTTAAGRKGMRLHDLRHSHGTMYAQLGATTAEIMAELGHSTMAASQRYQHATQRRASIMARRLSGMADTDAAIG